MLLTITLTITTLVIFNFLLLKFSVNKIEYKPKVNRKPPVILNPELISSKEKLTLAPTGS